MSIRWQFTRDSRFGVEYKIEITDSDFAGTATTLDPVGDRPVIKTYGQRNADKYDKILAETIQIQLFGEQGDFEDLFTEDSSRFRIKLYVDGSFDSEYIPLPDTYSEYSTEGSFTSTISGAGLAALKNVKATDILGSSRTTALQAIYDIVNHFYDYTVSDGVIYYPDDADQTTSALSQVTISPSRFDEESAYTALEWIVPRGHQIRVQEGKVFIVPVAQETFTGYEYNGSVINSGIIQSDDITAQKIGGRTAVTRRKQRLYNGVERTYSPSSAGNIIPNGSFGNDDFTDNGSIPNNWERDFATPTLSNEPTSEKVFSEDDTAWRIQATEWLVGVGEPRYFKADGEFISAGENFVLSTTTKYNNTNNLESIVFLLMVKVGDYFLVQNNLPNNPKSLAWTTQPPSLSSGEQGYIRITSPANIQNKFTLNVPAVPESGDLYYQVSLSTFNVGAFEGNTLDIFNITQEVTNTDFEKTSESVYTTGSSSFYEFTERFGDGFTSATPGALFYDNEPTETWGVKGLSGTGTLAQVQSSYLKSELSQAKDLLQGTYDAYDVIALINGKRVTYAEIDYRYGRSTLELSEIASHAIDVTGDEQDDSGPITVGPGIEFPDNLYPFQNTGAIGIVTETITNESRTSIDVELDLPVRVGIEYWIVNESELSRTDRFAGIYPFIPSGTAGAEFGPGEITLSIEEQFFNVPEGSFIFKSPDQSEVDDNVFQDRIDDAQANLDNLNNVELPALEADLEELNTVTLPNLRDDLDDAQAQLDAVLPITETKISDDAISTPKLQTNAVTAGKIIAGAITAIKISAGAVIAEKIATDAVTTNKIQAGAITAVKIGAGEVTANKIDVADLAAINATMGNLDINATLTILSGGEINLDNDLIIDSDGLFIDGTALIGGVDKNKINWDSGTDRAEFYYEAVTSPNVMIMKTLGSADFSIDSAAELRLTAENNAEIGFNSGDTVAFTAVSETTDLPTPTEVGYIALSVNGNTRYIRTYTT